jgi:hypothetical protein
VNGEEVRISEVDLWLVGKFFADISLDGLNRYA